MINDPIELHRAYKRLFECADGRTVMDDLERRGCYRRSSFSRNRDGPSSTKDGGP